MAHGHPDYGTGAPLSTVYSLQDLAELAARLNSIVTFDRRGNVILLEDFEGSLSKCICDYSAGGSVSISSKYSRGGSFSCKMVTGPVVDDFARIKIPLAYPHLSKMGFEACWNRSDDGALKEICFGLDLYDGVTLWWPEVRWVKATNTWECRISGAGWTSLSPTVNYFVDDLPFNYVKLVVDFVNKKYVKLIANDATYDLSDISIYSSGPAVPPRLTPFIITYTRVAAEAVNYIDNIIITQNEP